MDCQWFGSTLESFRGPGDAVMLDTIRTYLAKLVVKHLNRPRELVIRAWLWLAADSDDVEGKWRCLNAVLQLDPENEPTS